MRLQLVTAPAYTPITLTEVKTHLRIESSFVSDDAYLLALIYAATDQVEAITRRKLLTQTWKYFLDDWPSSDEIVMPFGELQSVTSVKYKDSGATEYTMDSGEYIVDADSDPGRVVLDYGETWPSETLLPANPIYIEYVCGYGAHTPQVITGASNAAPIVITLVGHGYSTGDRILIESVLGNTAANGIWTVTKLTDNTFSLNGSVGNDAYTSGSAIATVSDTDIDTGTETVDSFADTAADGCIWDYVIKNGANLRAGTIKATWDATGNTVSYAETSTADVGDTSGVSFSVDISGDLVRLRCTVTSDNWSFTGIRKLIAASTSTYTSGGYAIKLQVPEAIRQAVKLLCADMFEARGELILGQSAIENKTIQRLLASYRLWDEFG